MKNLFLSQNNPLSNSVVLNNYIIRNIIISPKKEVTHEKSPIVKSHYALTKKTSHCMKKPY